MSPKAGNAGSIPATSTNLKLNIMKEILDYIDTEMSVLDKGLVATPENRSYLDKFSGGKNPVLTQMAIQYGYKLALENLLEAINSK